MDITKRNNHEKHSFSEDSEQCTTSWNNTMLLLSICLGIFIMLFCLAVEARDINIAFWVSPVQNEIKEDIAIGIKKIQELQSDVIIKDFIIVVNSEDFEVDENVTKAFCDILSSDGISIVVDFTYQKWITGMDHLATHGIPILHVDRIISPMLHIFSEFLKWKGSNDLVLVFENEQDKTEAIFHMIEGYPFRTILINAIDEKNFVKRLMDLRPTPAYYTIFAKGTNMNTIFEKIHKENLFKRPEEWHFVFLDTHDDIFKHANEAENATKFILNSKSLCQSINMTEDYCLTEFTLHRAMILNILRSVALYAKSYPKGLLPVQTTCNGTGGVRKIPPNVMNEMQFTDFITFLENELYQKETDGQPSLSYTLNISISTFARKDGVEIKVANWQSGQLQRINETISPAKRFFRIGITEAIPWSYFLRDEKTNEIILDDKGNPVWQGFCIDVINALAEKLYFDYELIEPTKGKFGDRDPETGTWDGVVGDLVSGNTDFVVTALKMYSEREEVIDFLAPYFGTTGITIVMRKPIRQSSLFKFMTVLRLEVWLSIIGALVATAVMIWFLDKYSPYSSRNNPDAYPYPCRDFTLRESFWFALTSFTPQGGGEAPKAVSGRILVGAYWLFVVLMLATFTANLAAFLTVERMQTPVQNLEQLARQSRINYTVVSESDTHQYFINMKFAEDTLYRMWKELALNASTDYHKFRVWDYPIKEQYGHILISINASEPLANVSEGFRKVNEAINADFAFIHDSSEIKFELTRNCNLTEIGETFAEQPYAIGVQQGSHLSDEFSYAILELQKVRFFEDLKAKHWNNSRIKECSVNEEEEGITLESLGGVFIATLFGLGLAMVTLVVEVLYHKRKIKKSIKATNKITDVKPAKDDPKLKNFPTISNSWLSDKKLSSPDETPPPSFKSATYFRGQKVPPSITLGGEQFKPRRRGASDNQQQLGFTYSDIKGKNKALPSYVE